MQLSFVTVGPLKLPHLGRVRGETESVKQPEYDQDGFELDGDCGDDAGLLGEADGEEAAGEEDCCSG